ncbi:MAG: nucleotide exchange factor GrpE [bacterium]|nr:nucleotide exchange factor GrpE [bacterium]
MKHDDKSKHGGKHAAEKHTPETRVEENAPDFQKQLDELSEKLKACEKFEELYFKKAAEFDNYRKRSDRDRAQIIKLANEDILLEILPVVDNFERALGTPGKDVKSLHDGIALILKQLEKILESAGLKRIKSIGEKFNPHYHHAIGVVEKQDAEEDVVMEENLPGYVLFDKVIRPAMVRVSKKTKNTLPLEKNEEKNNVENKGAR